MPRLRAALEGADRRWLLETGLSVLALEDERRPLPPPDADLEAATRLEPERLAPGGAMARVWKGTPAERERIARATTTKYEANPTPVTREHPSIDEAATVITHGSFSQLLRSSHGTQN
jgi:hypothetical protein